MTDPTTTTLPNLSTWHSVPDGATIPANTPYAHSDGNSLTVVLEGYCRDLPAYGLAIAETCRHTASLSASTPSAPSHLRCRPKKVRRSWHPATICHRTPS